MKKSKSEIYLEASLDFVSSYIRGELNLEEAVKDLNNSDTTKKVRLKFSKTLIEITSSVFKQNPDLAIVQARRMWEMSKPIETISFMWDRNTYLKNVSSWFGGKGLRENGGKCNGLDLI